MLYATFIGGWKFGSIPKVAAAVAGFPWKGLGSASGGAPAGAPRNVAALRIGYEMKLFANVFKMIGAS